jgi:hypothetical protein
VSESTSTPNESLDNGVMYSFLEDSGGVSGVKGIRMLREETALDLPEGVSGESQISPKPAEVDTVETVDAGDSHENFFEPIEDGRLSPSPFKTDAERSVLPGVT